MDALTTILVYAGLIAIIPALVYRYYTRRSWQNVTWFGLAYLAANFLTGIVLLSILPENLIISITPQDYAARVAIGGLIAYMIYYVLLTQLNAFKATDRVWKIFAASYVLTILAKMIGFLYISAALNAGIIQSIITIGGI